MKSTPPEKRPAVISRGVTAGQQVTLNTISCAPAVILVLLQVLLCLPLLTCGAQGHSFGSRLHLDRCFGSSAFFVLLDTRCLDS
jgi:hypothetical protein